MVQVLDLLRTSCGPGGCTTIRSCWARGSPVVRVHAGTGKTSTLDKLFRANPKVIQANNPEVCAVLGDSNCLLVCDLEIDEEVLENGDWIITWFKMRPNGVWDPELVRECPRQSHSGDHLTLRIENVMYEDRGIYRCEVIDMEGKYAPSDAEFNVIVIPQDELIVSDDNDFPPLERMKVKVETPVSCNVGDKVYLVAMIENKPKKVKVEWCKMIGVSETSLNKKRVKITTQKVFSNAKIRSVVPDDSGVYRVKVTGAAGDCTINHIILNVNTDNCEVEISEMMKRAFRVAEESTDTGELTGHLPPGQVKEITAQLGLGLRRGNVDDLIYLAATADNLIDCSLFIEKFIFQYKSDLSDAL